MTITVTERRKPMSFAVVALFAKQAYVLVKYATILLFSAFVLRNGNYWRARTEQD